jgi:cyclic pyranopterin phosphate synthase
MGEFTHFNKEGNAIMVDVHAKDDTYRVAVAAGKIYVNEEVYAAIKGHTAKKGDVLGVARIAGIMGAKKTAELIPLCHLLNLTKVEIDFEYLEEEHGIRAICHTACTGRTGVEMEALTGVNTALLTIYDMCKAVDRGMEIREIHLLEKSGGKSGKWVR